MIEHFAIQFCEAYAKLPRWTDALVVKEKDDRPKQLNDRKLSDVYTRFVSDEALAPIITEIEHLGFDPKLIERAKLLRGRLAMPNGRTWTAESVLDALIDIRKGIGEELKKHKFAYLRSPNDQYFEQDQFFGSEVHVRFQNARQDIKDACNCFAMELYTACVFHLMRVAEHGLREIARRLHVTIMDKRVKTPIPIEYAEWQKVIDHINAKLGTLKSKAPGPQKQARLNYYSDGAQHCLFMKDIFRNDVSHARKPYIEAEALSAMQRVRDFMQFLTRSLPK